MKAATTNAAFVQPFKVMGRWLKPYSLWHQIVFQQVESGFAIGSKSKPGYEDLITSVFFCSRDYIGGLDQLSSPFFQLKMDLWRWRCGNFDIWEAIHCFYEYIEYYSETPNYWVETGTTSRGGESSVSYAQFLKVKMMQEFGMSEEQALNTPYNAAVVNYLTTLEGKGIIRFMTPQDEELIVETKKREEWLGKLAANYRNN